MLYKAASLQVYQPKMDQVTVYDRARTATILKANVVLGFGGSGQDLIKTFDVTYVGAETIDGIATAKLQLIPKSEKVRNTYSKILLWIDLERGHLGAAAILSAARGLPSGQVFRRFR